MTNPMAKFAYHVTNAFLLALCFGLAAFTARLLWSASHDPRPDTTAALCAGALVFLGVASAKILAAAVVEQADRMGLK